MDCFLIHVTVGLSILWMVINPAVADSGDAAILGEVGQGCFPDGSCGHKSLRCENNKTCKVKPRKSCSLQKSQCFMGHYCMESCVCCSDPKPVCRKFTDKIHGCALSIVLVLANVAAAWAVTFICFYIALECF